ncbi:unnamed protein product [Paramecium primaurelia]|uniref:Transmembrane protein n=1 Tax=Paramecium primaurelia TaxID=5886 RepID=A0A8S1MN74_PARPR|nr:unnamed protein product [Paramecium primaurelia]
MEEQHQLDIGSQVLPLVESQKHYFPPKVLQAELHGKVYKIHKGFQIGSQRCYCCNYHLIQDYFDLFCNIKEFKYNRAAYLYFLQLQQFIFLFCIPCITFLPYALYFNSQGDECEKMKNCIPSYYNQLSIWNQTQDYFQLDNIYLQIFYLLTILLSSVGVYLMIFGNKHKIFLSNQYSRAFLLQSVMVMQDQDEIKFKQERQALKNHQYIKVHSLDKFQETIKNQTEKYYIQAHLDNQQQVLDAMFQEKVNPRLIQLGTIIIFQSESEKIDFQIKNKDIIVENGEQRYITQNNAKINCKIILKILGIIIVAILTILSLAFSVYLQAKYLKTNSTLVQANLLKIFLNILFYFQIYFSNLIAKNLLHHNNYQQIYFTCLVIGFKNINRIFTTISNQEAYLQENGIIDNLIILCYLNIVLPNLTTIFDSNYLFNQFKKNYLKRQQRTNLAQIEINKYFEARQLSFELKQYRIFQICLIGQIFMIDFPLIAPLTLLALCIIYWIDKFIFVKHCIPFQNQWEEDNTLEIQKQQYLQFYIMYCFQNFFFFNNPLLIFGMLGYIIFFKIIITRKLDKMVFQNKTTLKPQKLKKYAQQYDLVHIQGEIEYIKHQYLYETFKILKQYLLKKLETTRTQIKDTSI